MLGGTDPSELVDKLTPLEKREALFVWALDLLGKMITEFQAKVSTTNRQKNEALRAHEMKKFSIAIRNLHVWEETFQEVEKVRLELSKCNVFPSRTISVHIETPVDEYLEFLRLAEPKMMGLPPKIPSAEVQKA